MRVCRECLSLALTKPYYYKLKMIKNLLFAATCALLTNVCMSQVVGAKEDKLAKLWEKEKYEDIAYKAEMMADKDRKNAELYLWASMSWYEISHSDDPKVIEYYKDPFKDALKTAAKFIKYDEELMKDANMDYLTTLKKDALTLCRDLMKEGDYRKATYTYRYLNDIFPMDDGILLMRGICDAHNNNSFDAERNINAAMKGMKMNYKPDEVVRPAMAESVVMFSDYLVQNEYGDSAKVVLNFASKYLPNDPTITDQLSKLSE